MSILQLQSGGSSWASHCSGFSCCGAWALDAWAQWLLHTGLAAPQHVESSWTRDWTCVPCTGRWDSKPLDQQGSPILLLFLLYCMTIQSILHVCGFCIHRVNQLWFENFWKKKQKTIPESPKKQNLKLCAGNYLHRFYTVFATIYIAFMLH